jgi:hypothetical protein
MKEIELAFLCKVFMNALEEFGGDMSDWYADEVSKNESDWEAFVETCKKLAGAP